MSSTKTITIRQGTREARHSFEGVHTVLELLQRSGFTVAAPCGGSGTCGKCLVRVIRGDAGEPSTMERRLLSEGRLAGGTRFACSLTPEANMEVEVPDWHGKTENKAALIASPLDNDPALVKRVMQLAPPSITDQRPDLERILAAGKVETSSLPLPALQELAATVRQEEYSVTLLLDRKKGRDEEWPASRLLAVEPGDTTDRFWGVAIDIGTTTVAAYLVDLNRAHTVDVYSELNRQAEFGADVVTRISYAQKNGVKPVQATIIGQINGMIAVLTERNKLSPAEVYLALVAGNTTMQHFFAGLDPAGIGVSPFIPVTTGALSFPAEDLGIRINRHGLAGMLPGISGYVGADVVAAIVASRMRERSEISLLIDIGTNGEIVLGNKEWLLACSTAAGPAFEGAQIRFGVGGIEGAVNTFGLNGNPTGTTIGSAAATGICGSGMLDIAAMLLKTGVIEATGRLLPAEELPDSVPSPVRERCATFEGSPAFMVVPAEETRDGEAIYLTEQDVRELQLAKAAIAAGVSTLLEDAQVPIEAVTSVYLAGGFGSYMNAESALAVGLLPAGAAGRIEVLGNAAGIGTVMSITSRTVAQECTRIAEHVRYIELSSSPAFQLAYIEQMTFGEV
ncbi:MAG: DUF4445 domain-containing protein [Spirochaetaceae bacterium]|nr:MAG: DUF4445 domain-containing protein [Spirochaetaceae bacterium]